MAASSPPRLLCIRRGGLGDTLLMVPVLRAWRRQHPGAHVTFAGVREFADLLAHYGIADAVCSSEDLALWALGGDSETAARARARLAGFDAILSDAPEVTALAGPAVTVFDPRLGAMPRVPAAEQLLARCGLDGPADATLVATHTPAADAAICLHPGSGSLGKNWPAAHFAALAAALLGAGRAVDVVLGPVELERGTTAPWPAGVRLVAPASPLALAAHLRGASAFVGNDTGPTHLAAALRVPTVALFGPTDPTVWAPAGAHAVVCRDGEWPAVAEVTAALPVTGRS